MLRSTRNDESMLLTHALRNPRVTYEEKSTLQVLRLDFNFVKFVFLICKQIITANWRTGLMTTPSQAPFKPAGRPPNCAAWAQAITSKCHPEPFIVTKDNLGEESKVLRWGVFRQLAGRNILHHLVPLLRQSIYSRLAGYDDTNDAVRLSQDRAMRVIVGWQGSERKGASTSEMGRFETEFLTQEDNLKGLARINTQWVERAMADTLHRRVILDMDSSESPVHGQQEGAAYNGHFECVCYHPLFLFNQFGDCEAAKLRSGNVHSADDWQEVLDPVVERYLTAAVRLLFRADAAFAKPEIYDYLEARNIGYAIRLRSNQVLQREIAPRLIRPKEWLSPKPIVSYHDFVYQAQSWNVARRVVSKVEWHQGELFPRVGFIVTNLSYPNIGIVRFYNGLEVWPESHWPGFGLRQTDVL